MASAVDISNLLEDKEKSMSAKYQVVYDALTRKGLHGSHKGHESFGDFVILQRGRCP